MDSLKVVPVDEARWMDLQTVFGKRGGAAACQCQRAILPMREYWHMPRDLRRDFLHEEIVGARPAAPGLLAYLGDDPVGWCRLGLRCQFAPLRNSPVPWAERREDKEDAKVWAVVCFVVRAGYRRRGISYALAAAAVDCARRHDAAAIEGYPMATRGEEITWGELHVGAVGAFRAAGFKEVTHPSKRRYAMRIDFGDAAAKPMSTHPREQRGKTSKA